MFRGEATEEENLEEMVRAANPEEIAIDDDDEDDEDVKIEGKSREEKFNCDKHCQLSDKSCL